MTVSSWTLTIPNTKGLPTSLTFHLVPGSSPLVVCIDMRAYCDTFNLGQQKYIRMKRPTDKQERCLSTYLVKHDNHRRLDISLHPKSKVSTLLGSVHITAKRAPLAFCKKIHRYTHSSKEEMSAICEDAGLMSDKMGPSIDAVCQASGQERKTKAVAQSFPHPRQ